MQIRFHLDESVHLAVAEGLRRRGIDVTIPKDVDLLGASDEKHLVFAHSEGRIVITHDTDFLALASRGQPHSGIAFCHNQSRTIGQIVRALEKLSVSKESEELIGTVEFL